VFIAVGATLYGFKLQEGLEKAKTLQTEAKDLRDKAKDDLQATQSKIKTLNDEVDKTLTVERKRLAKTELLLAQIQGNSDHANEMVRTMSLLLTPRQSASLRALRAAQPDKARQGLKNKYWANGAILRILFLDGDDRSRQAIKMPSQSGASTLTFILNSSAQDRPTSGFRSRMTVATRTSEQTHWQSRLRRRRSILGLGCRVNAFFARQDSLLG
jgi:hypothetical protein